MTTALPYPGIVKGKSRANFDELQNRAIILSVFKQFDFNLQNRQIDLVKLLPNYLIVGFIVRVQEAFNGSSTVLEVGTKSIPRQLGSTPINTTGLKSLTPNQTADSLLGNIITVKTQITVSLLEEGVTKSTRGSGWLLINYYNLFNVPGFREK